MKPGVGIGTRIADRYVVDATIAKGGMGVVFRAVDERLGRPVAIKVLLADLAEDKTAVARFERESSASARLSHPGIVHVLDFGKHEGAPYIVMEHVVGRTLASELEQNGRLAPARAADVIEQALAGVHAAHEHGIVHRDLKPGNIMLVPTGGGREVVKVLDFGIAQLKDSSQYVRLTQTGSVLGTPTFMAPEQTRGERCDARADVYALGVVLWCCLTGQRPFQAPDVASIIGKVLNEMPPRADHLDPSIPAAIAYAADRAMQKRPSGRYASAAEFAQALADARGQSSIPPTATVSLPEARALAGGARPASAAGGGAEITRVDVMRASHDATSPSLPPAMDGEGAMSVTREVPISTPPAAVSAPRPASPAAPAAAPAAPAGRGIPRWVWAIVVVLALSTLVLGALVVAGVVEIERGGVDVRQLAPR